jgi:hypothetical protein
MNTQKHTDGPWHITKEEKFLTIGTFITVRDSRDGVIAGAHVDAEANARLIAVAPDLLWMLKRLTAEGEYGQLPLLTLQQAREVISKAEGVK